MLFRVSFIINFFILATIAFGSSSIKLLGSNEKEGPPIDLGKFIGSVGVLSISQPKETGICTLTHIVPGKVITSAQCINRSKKPGEYSVHFYNYNKVRKTFPIKNILSSNSEIVVLEIPEEASDQWEVAGNILASENQGLLSFKPQWKLLRIWGYRALPEKNQFVFSINSCKSVLLGNPSTIALEGCIRPIEKENNGALITLAEDYSKKIGILNFSQSRILASQPTTWTGSLFSITESLIPIRFAK